MTGGERLRILERLLIIEEQIKHKQYDYQAPYTSTFRRLELLKEINYLKQEKLYLKELLT